MPIKPYVQEITYDHYCSVVAAAAKDKPEHAVFIPPELKTFLVELKHFMTMISMDGSGVQLQDIIAALQNRDLFTLLQAGGWSLKKVNTKMRQLLQVPRIA